MLTTILISIAVYFPTVLIQVLVNFYLKSHNPSLVVLILVVLMFICDNNNNKKNQTDIFSYSLLLFPLILLICEHMKNNIRLKTSLKHSADNSMLWHRLQVYQCQLHAFPFVLHYNISYCKKKIQDAHFRHLVRS